MGSIFIDEEIPLKSYIVVASKTNKSGKIIHFKRILQKINGQGALLQCSKGANCTQQRYLNNKDVINDHICIRVPFDYPIIIGDCFILTVYSRNVTPREQLDMIHAGIKSIWP